MKQQEEEPTRSVEPNNPAFIVNRELEMMRLSSMSLTSFEDETPVTTERIQLLLALPRLSQVLLFYRARQHEEPWSHTRRCWLHCYIVHNSPVPAL
jgi:hypothetical protein